MLSITHSRISNEGGNICVCYQHTDMPEEMRVETMELCVTACEKFATNNEVSVFWDSKTLSLGFVSKSIVELKLYIYFFVMCLLQGSACQLH